MATQKQKKALANYMENHGVASRAMLDAGYSENSAKNPKNLTQSKGWAELVEQQLPDKLLTKVHKEGLAAFKYETQLTGKGESEIVQVPDFGTRHKYLETGYKVKGKYQEGGSNNILVINVSGESQGRYGTQQRSIDNS